MSEDPKPKDSTPRGTNEDARRREQQRRRKRKRSRTRSGESRRQRSARRRRILLLGLLLVPMLALAVSHSIGGAATQILEHRFEGWRERAAPPSERQWQSAFGLLRLAESTNPSAPDTLGAAAKLWRWRAHMPDIEREPALTKALDYQRRDLAARPAWPYAWVDLAQLKSELRQFDHEFLYAFMTASRQGPWESEIQLALIEIGLKHWRHLDQEARDTAARLVDNAVTGQPDRFFGEIQRTGDLPMVCVLFAENRGVSDYCVNRGGF